MSALLELRAYLHSSSLLLDVSCTSLEQLFEKIVDTWVEDGNLGVHDRNVALDTLNKRFRHQHETNDAKLTVPSLLHVATSEAFGRRSGSSAGGYNVLSQSRTSFDFTFLFLDRSFAYISRSAVEQFAQPHDHDNWLVVCHFTVA